MRFYQSIRWRLQIWYGLLLIAVLAGFGAAVYRVESEHQFRRVDGELQRRLQVLGASRHPVPNSRPPRQGFALLPENAALFDEDHGAGFYYVVWLHGNEAPSRSSSAPAVVPMPEGSPSSWVRDRGTMREAFILPAPGDCLLVGHPMERDLVELRHFVGWLVAAGGAVVLLGLAVGAYLVYRALKPIHDISAAAQKVATGDLTQRITGPTSGSELGQLVNVLNSTFSRLDAAFSQQARFTADAAHELRTPVSVVLAQTQYGLSNGCENEEQREVLEASQRAANRMRRLIDSLLELARLDGGQQAPERQPYDVASITAECIEFVQPMATKRGIEIHADLRSAVFVCDADQFAQVATNLLTNAIHYNRDGGEIHVSTRRDKGMTVLVVHNTGPGIAARDLPLIFDRFYRADKARSGGNRTGLGLSIVKAIVQSYGGSIEATSVPGKSATFTVALPG